MEIGTAAAVFNSVSLVQGQARVYHAEVSASWHPKALYAIAASYGADFQHGDIRTSLLNDRDIVRHVFLVELTVAPRLSRTILPTGPVEPLAGGPKGVKVTEKLLGALLATVCMAHAVFASGAESQSPEPAANASRCRGRRSERPPLLPSIRAPPRHASAFQIGPEDILDISVWKNPELSRTVPVRPDGKVSLPLVNDIQAAGLTPATCAIR